MVYCKRCGASTDDKDKFCTACGAPVSNDTPETEQSDPNAQTNTNDDQSGHGYFNTESSTPPYSFREPTYVPERKGEVSVGMFIGVFFLFMIPVVGLIVAIIWACGGTSNRTLVNFARASLVMMVIAIVLAVVIGLILAAFLALNYNSLVEFSNEVIRSVNGISFVIE